MANLASTAGTPAMRGVLEQAAALHRRAAAILQANGMWNEAARAERFAARTRLMLDEPKATRQMHALTHDLYRSPDLESLLERALEGAMSLIGGDFGNLQLSDPTSDSLRIATQHAAAASRIYQSSLALRADGNGSRRALALQEWALLARDRARHERERAQASAVALPTEGSLVGVTDGLIESRIVAQPG